MFGVQEKPALRSGAPLYSKARSPLLGSIVLKSLLSALGLHCTQKPDLRSGAPRYSKPALRSGAPRYSKVWGTAQLKIIPGTIRGSNSSKS